MIPFKSCTGRLLLRLEYYKRAFAHGRATLYFSFAFFLFPLLAEGQGRSDSLLNSIQNVLPTVQSTTEQYIQKLELEKARAQKELKRIESKLLSQIKKRSISIEFPEIGTSSFGTSLLPQAYVPKLDSLLTSLKYLKDLENISSSAALFGSIDKLGNLQLEFNKLQYFRAAINVRKESIENKLASLGLKKSMSRYSKSIAKVQGGLQQVQEAYKDPDKALAVALQVLSQSRSFRNFFAKQSILSNFFRLPVEGEPIDVAMLAGLQTRDQMERNLIEKFGSNSMLSQLGRSGSQMPGMSSFLTMAGIERGLPFEGGSVTEVTKQNIPSTETSRFKNRVKFGVNMQTVRAAGIFPTMSDLGLSVGYSATKILTVGIGISGRVGWGNQSTGIRITGQGASARSFAEVGIKGGIYASVNAEMNYFNQITKVEQLKEMSAWRFSGLAGITKRFNLRGGKSTQLQLLYDFFHRSHGIETQPVLFRVGYGF